MLIIIKKSRLTLSFKPVKLVNDSSCSLPKYQVQKMSNHYAYKCQRVVGSKQNRSVALVDTAG